MAGSPGAPGSPGATGAPSPGGSGAPAAANWQPYTAPDGSFTVEAPAEIKVEEQGEGDKKVVHYATPLQSGLRIFHIAEFNASALTADQKTPAGLLKEYAGDNVDLKTGEGTVSGLPAAMGAVQMQSGDKRLLAAVVTANKAYVLEIVTPKDFAGDTSNQDANRFVNSFQLKDAGTATGGDKGGASGSPSATEEEGEGEEGEGK